MLDRSTRVLTKVVCLGKHAYCLCVILMIVCFCFGRFFCYFLWALGVTLLPLWKSIPDTGPKAIREETVIWKLSSTVWNFPLTAWWRELPGLTTDSILDWLPAPSICQCNLHSRNYRISQTTAWVPDSHTSQIKGIVNIYGLSLLWVQVEPWNIPDASQKALWSTVFSKKDSWIPCCL